MVQLMNTDGAWIAIGMSVLFVVAGLVMHRVFVRILKNEARESSNHD
jgi:heme exporter protein D